MKFIHDVEENGHVSVIKISYNEPMEDSTLSSTAAHRFITLLQMYEAWINMVQAQGSPGTPYKNGDLKGLK